MFEKINTKEAGDCDEWRGFFSRYRELGASLWRPALALRGRDAERLRGSGRRRIGTLLPAAYGAFGPPVFRLTVHALRSDCGLGREWAARNPSRSQFHEAVVAFNAAVDGIDGNWDPFMWTDAEPQLCVGRELYGFSMRLGDIGMTRRPALNGWRRGDIVAAHASQDGRLIFSIEMSVERNGPDATPPPVPATPVFYSRRTLPRPEEPCVSDITFCRTTMQDLRIGEVWSGSGSFRIEHEQLGDLAGGRVLGARWSSFEMTKPPAEVLGRWSVTGSSGN